MASSAADASAAVGGREDPRRWTSQMVSEWARETIRRECEYSNEDIDKIILDLHASGKCTGAVLSVAKDIHWEKMVPHFPARVVLQADWEALLQRTRSGLDKGKKRDASRSDDDAADSTTRDASEVRKRARSVYVDDNNNESV
eukprot:Opistho-2@65948